MFSYEDSKYVPLSANSARISMTVTYWNKSVYGNDISSIIGFGSVGGEGNFSYSNKKINYQNGKYYISADITFPYEPKSRTIAYPTINIGYYRHSFSMPFEYEAPKITSANIIYGTQINGYSVKAKLSVSCTDNWNYDPNYVQFRLVDKYKNGITNWITCNKQNNTYSQICDLIMEVNDIQTFYIQAKDVSGNLSERLIEIKNLDSKAPTTISNDKTSTNWTTQKEYKAEAIDEGVGNVKMAFNDNNYVETIKNDNTYSQNYIFTGDVYGSTIGAVYYKDALGNETTQFITISNIDNTTPTITNTKITYEKTVSIEVTANDNKDFGGDVGVKEGSGIAGYAISESKTAPDTFQTSNILEVPKTGDYYIYVKDNVGNIQSKHIGKIKTECEIDTSYIGVGSISNSSKTKYTENTSIYIVPADGFQISKLKIDNVLVNPVKQYDFISIEKDHKVEATFTITQSKKMELMQKGYSWIDLKL